MRMDPAGFTYFIPSCDRIGNFSVRLQRQWNYSHPPPHSVTRMQLEELSYNFTLSYNSIYFIRSTLSVLATPWTDITGENHTGPSQMLGLELILELVLPCSPWCPVLHSALSLLLGNWLLLNTSVDGGINVHTISFLHSLHSLIKWF